MHTVPNAEKLLRTDKYTYKAWTTKPGVMCNVQNSFPFYGINIEMKIALPEEKCHMGGTMILIGHILVFAYNVLYSLLNEVLPLKWHLRFFTDVRYNFHTVHWIDLQVDSLVLACWAGKSEMMKSKTCFLFSSEFSFTHSHHGKRILNSRVLRVTLSTSFSCLSPYFKNKILNALIPVHTGTAESPCRFFVAR